MALHSCLCRRPIYALPILVMLIVCAPSAWACTCRGPTPEQLPFAASIIFRGTMLEVQKELFCSKGAAERCRSRSVGTFAVEETLKGDLGSRVRIYAPEDGCTPYFRVGDRVSVAAIGNPEWGYVPAFCAFVPHKGDDGFDPMAGPIAEYRNQLKELDEAVASRPDSTDALFNKAQFLADTGNAWEAQEPLDRLLRIGPVRRDAVLLRARLFARFGHDVEVLGTLKALLDAHPADTEAMRLRVDSLIRTGQVSRLPPDWRDFTGLRANGADFSGRNLDHAVFRDVHLSAPLFAGADLGGADFSKAKIWDGDFFRANLAGASLRNAYFRNVVLREAKLDGADLTRADLRRADLAGASLESANLTGAVYNDATIWPDGFDPNAAGAIKNNL